MADHETRACRQPWETINISADGRVYPCCVIAAELEVGDIAHESLIDILNGPRIIAFRERLIQGDIIGLPCVGCPNAPMKTVEEFRADLAARFFPT